MKNVLTGAERVFLVKGEAGTGKTFTLMQLAKHAKVAYTAPTNKAVTNFLSAGANPSDCMTIYKMLGLALIENEGESRIEKKTMAKYNGYEYIVIDECSMLTPEVCEHIKKARNYVKVIFSGDKAQSLPVGIPFVSPSFGMTEITLALTEQMRQQSGEQENPLKGLLAIMRDCVDNADMDEYDMVKAIKDYGTRIIKGNPTHGIYLCKDRADFEQKSIAMSKKYGYGYQLIAYHNAAVDFYNKNIRKLHADQSKQYSVGEHIIFNAPYAGGAYYNGQVVEIEKIEEKQEVIFVGMESVETDCLLINDKIICAKNRLEYKEFLKYYADMARSKAKGYSWKQYYSIKEQFADLSHCYAITVLKSQGSTYDNVGVNISDILTAVSSSQEKKCNIYTALSRPKYLAIAYC